MPYLKDPDAYTRGAGAIQAVDKVRSKHRARVQLDRLRDFKRLDRKRFALVSPRRMGLGDGLIKSSGGSSSSTTTAPPATVSLMNTMLNIGNQKVYSKGGTPGPSLASNEEIDANTVAALNAILASGLSPLNFIDARISTSWIAENKQAIVTGLQQWLGYGTSSGNDLVMQTVSGPKGTNVKVSPNYNPYAPPSGASSSTPPVDVAPPSDTAPAPVVVVDPGIIAPQAVPGSGLQTFVAENKKALVVGGIALAAFLLWRRRAK